MNQSAPTHAKNPRRRLWWAIFALVASLLNFFRPLLNPDIERFTLFMSIVTGIIFLGYSISLFYDWWKERQPHSTAS